MTNEKTENNIATALKILMGFPAPVREGTLALAFGIADMTPEEREELKRTFELVSEYATQRPRKQQKTDGKPVTRKRKGKESPAGAPPWQAEA